MFWESVQALSVQGTGNNKMNGLNLIVLNCFCFLFLHHKTPQDSGLKWKPFSFLLIPWVSRWGRAQGGVVLLPPPGIPYSTKVFWWFTWSQEAKLASVTGLELVLAVAGPLLFSRLALLTDNARVTRALRNHCSLYILKSLQHHEGQLFFSLQPCRESHILLCGCSVLEASYMLSHSIVTTSLKWRCYCSQHSDGAMKAHGS